MSTEQSTQLGNRLLETGLCHGRKPSEEEHSHMLRQTENFTWKPLWKSAYRKILDKTD